METIRNIQGTLTAADFWANYGSATPRVCLCVKITPKPEFGGSAAAIGFTSNTREMVLPGHSIVFQSAPAITPTQIEKALDEPMTAELTGIYQATTFTEEEVLAGKWSFALLELIVVCWDNLNLGEWVAGCGYLGDFTASQSSFKAELRGKLSLLSNDVSKVTSNLCRVKKFGDAECKKDLNGAVTIGGTIYNLRYTLDLNDFDSNFVFSVQSDLPQEILNLWANGVIKANGGANTSVEREIKFAVRLPDGNTQITLKRRFPFPLAGSFTITAGCDRTLDACRIYENVINRRAEDWIPTPEAASKTI